MSDIKKTLEGYPDISFIENMTLENLKEQMIADFTEKYKEETGEELTLGLGDPNRLVLYAAALQIYQGMQYIDNAGKQSFLKYSYSGFLENLGALKGIQRNPGNPATAIERFTVSAVQNNAISIPMGTRVTAGDNVYFYTVEDAEIPAGAEYIDIQVECTEAGTGANGYEAGKINILVDSINYIGSVANTTKSEGGAEEESDEQLADRIYLAPSSYSTAGPDDAYEYWVKTCNSGITDVKVQSPSDGVVEIRFIMQDGTIPGEATLQEVATFLQNEKIRPLTDKVEVKAPVAQNYTINLTYYIAESDKNQASAIQQNVNSAVDAYKMWQCEKIGRDINPSYLMRLIMNAGAKRAVIASPEFTVVSAENIALCTTVTVTYGGVESD